MATYGWLDSSDDVAQIRRERLNRLLTRRTTGSRLRLILWALVLLVAGLPLLIYITQPTLGVLIFMLAIVVPAQLILVLRTLTLAIEETTLERAGTGWDVLVMTGVSACQIAYSKWWAVTQTLWPEWIFATLARLGIAYGLAQFLYIDEYDRCLRYLPRSICYIGDKLGFLNPPLWCLIPAIGLLAAITLFEFRMTAAVGVVASLLPLRRRSLQWTAAILIWLVPLSGAGVGTLILNLEIAKIPNEIYCWRESFCYDLYGDYVEAMYRTYSSSPQVALVRAKFPGAQLKQWYWHIGAMDTESIANVTQLGVSAVADSGTLLTANMLRPFWYSPLKLFVQNLAGTGIAIILCKAITWTLLRAAESLAVRLGASPEPRKQRRWRLLRRPPRTYREKRRYLA